MVKKDKLQDSLCCVSIATLIGGVATAALGQWWLLVIAICLIVVSLWWMVTASTSIEAEAGRCKVNLNGPLEWIDTHFKENALIPVLKGYIIKPLNTVVNSTWAKYIDEAKQTIRERMGSIDEEFLDTFNVGVIIQRVNELIQKDRGNYMKIELARERHRVDLENEEHDVEHPYKEAILYSPMPFKMMLAGEPSEITLDNYPGEEGIDIKIKTIEVAMIGMPMIQSTIPFIVVLPWLAILEEIIERLIPDDSQKEVTEKPHPRRLLPVELPSPVPTPLLSAASGIPAPVPKIPLPVIGPTGDLRTAGVMVEACIDLWGRLGGKGLLRKRYSRILSRPEASQGRNSKKSKVRGK